MVLVLTIALVLGVLGSVRSAQARVDTCRGQARSVSRVADDIGPVVGTGPVRAGAVSRNGVARGRPLERPLGRWLGSKVLWAVRQDMGPVEIRGRRQGSGDLVRWNDGRDARTFKSESEIEALDARLKATPTPLPDSGWSQLPSGPIFPGSGCYVFTVRGDTSTAKVVLRARSG